MPSSKLRRSPARTLSAIGLSAASEIWNSLVMISRANFSCLPARDPYRRAPEQKKQNTNIAVHREKRSIHASEIVRAHQRMLVGQERGDHGDSGPCGPRQMERSRETDQQQRHQHVHLARDHERARDSETFWNREET